MLRKVFLRAFVCLAFVVVSAAQDVSPRPSQPAPPPIAPPQQPNTDPTYQALRNIGLSGETTAVSNLVLKRDAGTFGFRTGTFQFLAPVNGKVTGAVFQGEGSFTIAPPLEMEKKSLAILTKGQPFSEDFSQVVLRFTDGSYEEIKKAAGTTPGTAGGSAASALSEVQFALKKKLNYNLHGRILQDVLSGQPGGLFMAFIKGRKYNDKMIFAVDPHGVPWAEPEEVSLMTWDENNYGIWTAFHYAQEYAAGKVSGKEQNRPVDLQNHRLDTTLEKNARLRGQATTTFASLFDGVRVVPFSLFRTLRVESVTGAEGQSLAFIQEDKDDDPQLFVILPRPLAKGERYSITTVYQGKDAVSNEGGGNYFPIARANWYPNSSFGDYAQYEMIFRVPKGMETAATGALLREYDEGNQTISEWRSEVPLAVAGFNFGQMKVTEAKLDGGYVVQSFANDAQPDWIRSVQTLGDLPGSPQGIEGIEGTGLTATGTMNTTTMMNGTLAQGQLAVQLFTSYFGPLPYKRIAMTQQTACNFGQAWPGVVYLPLCSFLDATARHALFQGARSARSQQRLNQYFKIVAPHEVAHQWWGHAVGFGGYRDQWMSEGFAEMSASLFVQVIQKNDKEFIQLWNELREQLTDRNEFGYRAVDVGPVTMGYRVETTKTSGLYFDLVYPKGAYILHMLRMMMWTPQHGDQRFQAMMKDFVRTYANQPATTEEFKATVEKYMAPDMDLVGNRRMDWFFNQYVYGTYLPHYRFQHSIQQGGDGKPVLRFKIEQSNVDPQFRMIVPVYVEYGNGKVGRLGTLEVVGNSAVEQQVPLGGLKERPRRAILNYYNDVLCTQENVK